MSIKNEASVYRSVQKLASCLRPLLAGLALVVLLSSAFAQPEAPKPRKELDPLKQLVGVWDADTGSGGARAR